MNKPTAIKILCALAVLMLTAGCASTSPQLYTLSPMAKPVNETSTLTITVGPVSLPAAVDRPQLVLSVAPNQVTVDEFNRWASPLKNDIARVVAENLSALLGSPYVSVFPQTVSLSPSYRVTIDVLRFESVPGETAKLNAIWSVRSTADGKIREGGTTLAEPVRGNTYAALIAAHSRMLGGLSGDIAASIRRLSDTAQKGNSEVIK
ncbi:MAG: PqiC family protein [Syntrophales bacterium]